MTEPGNVSPTAWVGAVQTAFIGVAEACFGVPVVAGSGEPNLSNQEPQGAYIPLFAAEGGIQLGIASTREGCLALTRMFLGASPEDLVGAEDVADAIAEIANMTAGSVQRLMVGLARPVELGLPLFVRGEVDERRLESRRIPLCVGALPVVVIVLMTTDPLEEKD